MLSLKTYRNWEINDYDQSLSMIVVGYDPEMKKHYIENKGFDSNCKISDKSTFVEILYKMVGLFISNSFIVKLKEDKFSWLPKWMKEQFNDYSEIERYLNGINWKKKRYYGSFKIENLKSFFSLFIDYPLKYEYQDIELFSIDRDFVIVISYHGTVWIVSDEFKTIRDIALNLEDQGVTVFPRKYLE